MKKLLSVALIIFLFAALLCACSGEQEPAEAPAPDTETAEAAAPDTAPDAAGTEEVPESPEDTPEETEETVSLTPPAPEYVPDPDEEFVPVLRFVVCSDVHVESRDELQYERVQDMVQTAYAYADSQKAYQALDAIVVVGDLTNDGSADQLRIYKEAVTEYLRDGTELINMLGNHEWYSGKPNSYRFIIDQDYSKHLVINGYHFISLSPDVDSNEYSDDLLAWLKVEVRTAAEDAPDQPIFVFQHHHLQDTVYVSRGIWRTTKTDLFREAFAGYPQVIDFSGHSHGPMNHPFSIWQDDFTMLGTGTLKDFELEEGMTEGTHPSGARGAAQFYIVEVNAENLVKIQPYNMILHDFFKTPSNTDDPDKQLLYYLPYPADPAGFSYTEGRKLVSEAPYFGEGAEISVNVIANETGIIADFSTPQAFDDDCIYGYRLVITDPDGNSAEYTYFARFYFEPLAETSSYAVQDGLLQPSTTYRADIYPIDAWDQEGEPISTEFTTPAA